MLLRLIRFVYIGMCPIPHTSVYRQESKLLKLMEIDELRLDWVPYIPRTTVKEYLVLSWNVPLGTGTYCTPEQE